MVAARKKGKEKPEKYWLTVKAEVLPAIFSRGSVFVSVLSRCSFDDDGFPSASSSCSFSK